MNLHRLPNETIKQYKIRLFENMSIYNLTTNDIAKLINNETGDNFGESAYRKWYRPYKEGYEDALKKISTDNNNTEINELLKARNDIYKERCKLQREKTEYNAWRRQDALEERFVEKIIDSIKENAVHDAPIRRIETKNNTRYGLLSFADCHFGKDFIIYGLNNEIINQYNPEIFYQRMEELYNKTLDIVKKEGLDTIKIFSLGDTLDGFIRHSQIWTLRYGVVDSSIMYAKYISKWLKRLSNDVKIEYHQTHGNHCELRLLDGKKNEHLNDNIEKFVKAIIEIENQDNPNFTIVENKTGLIYTNIADYNILGIHGEVKDLNDAIKDFSDFYNVKIDYIIAGHKHHATFANCGARKGCIGVGSIMGVDNFAETIKKKADATATFTIFEENYGRTIDYTIVLD